MTETKTPLTDALVCKINADMDLAEASGTEISADIPMKQALNLSRTLELRCAELERAIETAISDGEQGNGIGVLLLTLKQSRAKREGGG